MQRAENKAAVMPDRPPRDSQRARVYAAEDLAFGMINERTLARVGACCEDLSQDEVALFVSAALGDRPLPSLRFKRGGAAILRFADWQGARGAELILPLWAMRRWVICHELAHLVTRRKHGTAVASHGPEFCFEYLSLVRGSIGEAAEARLLWCFRLKRVKFVQNGGGKNVQ